jgi:hypothetical protein
MRVVLLSLLGLAACADAPKSLGDDLSDRQLPPRGSHDLSIWLEAGHYNEWHCEASVHPAAPESPHGPNRICNNDALHEAIDEEGDWPVGAAAVKEVFKGSTLDFYAVSRRVESTPGAEGWYWYEGIGDEVYSDGQDIESCVGCHAGAARDFVFVVVP